MSMDGRCVMDSVTKMAYDNFKQDLTETCHRYNLDQTDVICDMIACAPEYLKAESIEHLLTLVWPYYKNINFKE